MPASEITKQQRRGVVASCGCKRRESIGNRNRRHGMSKSPAYAVWRSMLGRCLNPSHQAWENYGGRGITVCERWQEGFEPFWADMGPTYQPGLTLERRDNGKGYSPENCKWATPQQQNRNRRSSRLIDTPWGRMTVTEAAERSGVKKTTLHYRLKVGVDPSDLFKPADVKNRFTTS